MAVRGGYGLAFDRLMNLPAENYRHSPPLRASVVLGQFFGTPQFTYSLGDPSKPYLGYPGRSGAAGRPRFAQRRRRRAGRPHDRRSGAEEPVRAQLVPRRPARDLARHRRRRQLPRARPAATCTTPTTSTAIVGDLLDGRFDGFNPSFRHDQHGDVDVELRLSRRHDAAAAELPAGLHAAGRVHLRPGDERRRHRRSGTTPSRMPPTSAPSARVAGYDVAPQAVARRAVGAAVLQGRHRAWPDSCSAAGSWRARRSSRPASPINVTNSGAYPARRLQRRRQRRRSPERAGRRRQAGADGARTSTWPASSRPSDFPTPAPGQNGNLARNAFRGPGYVDVSLSLSKKFRVQRWSGEFRLDAFNAFNRVNLADPIMDLSNTNFGRVTSQLAPRAFQMGVRLRF